MGSAGEHPWEFSVERTTARSMPGRVQQTTGFWWGDAQELGQVVEVPGGHEGHPSSQQFEQQGRVEVRVVCQQSRVFLEPLVDFSDHWVGGLISRDVEVLEGQQQHLCPFRETSQLVLKHLHFVSGEGWHGANIRGEARLNLVCGSEQGPGQIFQMDKKVQVAGRNHVWASVF